MDEGAREGGEFRPQYLDLPHRPRGGGGRNIFLGMLFVFGAALLLSYATYLVGARAILPVGVALLTAMTLFALTRLRLFRQRNGGFVALGLVCLLGVSVPLVEYAWVRDADDATGPYDDTEEVPARSERTLSEVKTVPRSLKEAFNLPTPQPATSGFRVLQDLRVDIDGKKYIIKEGDAFVVGEVTGEDVRFSAGDEQIALPLNMVELIGNPEAGKLSTVAASTTPPSVNPANVAITPEKSGPVNITEEAQREAIRRYPAIGVKNSPENLLFVDSYQELKHSGAEDFLANPEWPLALAEMLAKREGWNKPTAAPAQPTQIDEAALLDEAPRPKRRPVAEELDDDLEPEMADAPEAPAKEAAPKTPDPGTELPTQ